MKLNHCANRISAGSMDIMISLFTGQLGFRMLRRAGDSVWLRQGDTKVDIQFSETDTSSETSEKENSHIAFLSSTPHDDLLKIAQWFRKREIDTTIGSWSDKEFYLDVPQIFIDFVIEAMLPELAQYDDSTTDE